MIQHPAIISLLVSSAIICFLVVFAGAKGAAIIRQWDISSGSERQLQLERSTYLISTILGFTLFFQVISLFLYIFTTDYLHNLFVGAMCAAGTLNANHFGYPVLTLKIFTCLFAGVWLVFNHVDSKGYDYPLIKAKYLLLLALVPCVAVETALQFLYFGGLKAQVITSCCGSLFSAAGNSLTSDLAALPRVPMEIALAVTLAAAILFGVLFRLTGKGGYLFAVAGTFAFVISVASLISFISLYVYELPTHHCPFCILHSEYTYIGYPLYGALLVAGISSISVGALMPARNMASLKNIVPAIQSTLTTVSVILYLLFGLATLGIVWLSELKF